MNGLDVFPRSTVSNRADVRRIDAVLNCDCLLHLATGTEPRLDVLYLRVSEFGCLCSFALNPYVPAFADHVMHVVGGGTEEQVIGVHACPVVALVQHPQPIRDWAIHKFKGNTMSGPNDPGYADIPVTPRFGTEPHPAITRAVGTGPQPVSDRTILAGHSADSFRESVGAMLRAVSTAPGLSHAFNCTVNGGAL